MNKNAIQKYAIWARNELIEQVKQRAYQYGISAKGYGDENAAVVAGRVLSAEEKRQRAAFVSEIKRNGFEQAVEDVAYTWFNRFVALRFMEVNDYLPTHVRVFSDASGGFNPEILKDVLHLELEGLDKSKVSELLNANQTEELYRYLLLTQCNALNDALPEMFEKLGSYTEMLLPNNILKQDSLLARLVKDIDEDDWKDAVQIIGWMYQHYNTEPKQAVFDGLKKNVKITKEKIPAATQLFTPDWIVRYMVENSLGRLWLESHPNDALKANWKYYLDEAEQTPEVAEKLRVLRSQSSVKSPEDIRLIDPCMGSGHILVYAFDVLMQIYASVGVSPRDAAKLILEKNIYGLDIDRRAYQLAYFSLMMKARQYSRRIFSENVKPQVYHPAGFPDGEEYGSLVRLDKLEPMPELPKEQQMTLFDGSYDAKLSAWNFKRLLAQKYDVVVTNPPYMGGSGMGAKLSEYVRKNYPDSKSDLFAVFIEKCGELLKPTGYQAMITQPSFLFLSSFEKLRVKIIKNNTISNLIHMGRGIFGIDFGSTTFIIKKQKVLNYTGCYFKLHERTFQYIDPDDIAKLYLMSKGNTSVKYDFSNYDTKTEDISEDEFSGKELQLYYETKQENFTKIPGSPVAYWVSENMLNDFSRGISLSKFATPRTGIMTGDNNRFLRLWWEVFNKKINFVAIDSVAAIQSNAKWFPYNKGGEFRKWYGNDDYVIDWENGGTVVFGNAKVEKRNAQDYPPEYKFQPAISWSLVTSGQPAFRAKRYNLSDIAGPSLYTDLAHFNSIIAFCNSVVALKMLNLMNPTINYQAGNIGQLPVVFDDCSLNSVNEIVDECIKLSRNDWNSFETSWDFKRHPLICGERTVSVAFAKWESEAAERFDTLKSNEEELNRIFIDIYGLHDELTPEVEDNDVTVRRADLGREIRSLISYAVGCMFGRYSLDTEGLAYAGGVWAAGKYHSFIPDKDNILPISDDEYFDDDILGRFIVFVRVVYGAETLEENLKFIADALGGKGTPREVIRNYFLTDFYKDHCKIYQKRPIYWLFDSGKKNGFKSLVYLHRYQSDLLAKLRTDYVHEQQERYRTQLSHIAVALNTATGSERARLLKQQDKLSEQLKEITAFEEKVHHLADQNIEIDLDEGVKKNYEIFTDVLAKI
jgi:hypothetical protein